MFTDYGGMLYNYTFSFLNAFCTILLRLPQTRYPIIHALVQEYRYIRNKFTVHAFYELYITPQLFGH